MTILLRPGIVGARQNPGSFPKPKPTKKKHNGVVLNHMSADGFKAFVITVNPKCQNTRITPAFSPGYSEFDRNYPTTTFHEINRVYNPTAVVNGTFFDAFSKKTVCNVVVNGKLVCEGDRGSTIYVDREGTPGMLLTSKLLGRNIDWSDFQWAIQSGPTLLYNGRIILNPGLEGFTDPALYRPTRRTAVGITKQNKLIFVVIPGKVTLKRTAIIMKKLGAVYAINLDGGASSGMSFKGKYPVKPGRTLANFIMIYEDGRGKVLPNYPEIKGMLKGRKRMLAKKYKKKGDNFRKQNRYGAALKYYIKASRKVPYETSIIATIADTLKESGRPQKAAEFYGKASVCALESGFSKASWQYARQALKFDQENRDALDTIEILKNYPQYPSMIQSLGQKKYMEAYPIALSLLQRDSSNPRFYFALARIFSGLNLQHLKARAFYLAGKYFRKNQRYYDCYLLTKHAVESDPGEAAYRKLLAQAAERIGNKVDARYHEFLFENLVELSKSKNESE